MINFCTWSPTYLEGDFMNAVPEMDNAYSIEYEQYLLIVKRYAQKFSSRSSHPEELREELFSIGTLAFLEAFERYKSFTVIHRIRALSLRIRGEMVDYLAKSKRQRERFINEDLNYPASRRAGPEYRHILSDIRLKLDAGFQNLTYEECLILQNFLTGKEKYRVREISPSNRTKIKQRAFKKLRKHLSFQYEKSELFSMLAE